MKKIAVLALQGAFIEHEEMIKSLCNVEVFEIRKKEDWQQHKDGLIIPGGESTTMIKLLHELDLLNDIQTAISNGLPVFGTCAGLILLAKNVVGESDVQRIATMDIEVVRNAYGRQLGSFETNEKMKYASDSFLMTFIRAPYIKSVGKDVEVLAEVNGHIVAAKQANQLVTSFHPELGNDASIHAYFLEQMVK